MKKFLPLLFVMVSVGAVAQQVKLLSGDLSRLKGQKSFNMKFTYDSMIVGTDTPERSYLKEKEKAWDEKEQNSGFDFVEMWFRARVELYEPEFKKNFEKYSGKKVNDQNASFTIIVKTTRTEGGWDGGVLNSPAEIEGILSVVDSNDKSKVIAIVGFNKFRGPAARGGDSRMAYRISDAYASAGGGLGDYFKRKSK